MNTDSLNRFLRQAAGRQDVVFAVFLLIIVAMFVLPMPTFVIDIMIALNITAAILIIATATYLKNVLDLSTFPSMLLITTVFRLALTISTTRLILTEADAGAIIDSFGAFIVGGNAVVGLVVFFIIAIVNFIVITKGAERIAEVSARFTLDALPGKQMAIDAELRSGDIDAAEARRRRAMLTRESQFFGAMDGAMRFVKGDAIAGLVIIFVNLIGGLIIGMVQLGMSFGEAGQTYSLLSVGDGLVSQLPAMLISVAAGTVVTRVVGEEARDLATDMSRQMGAEPRAIWIAAGAALVLALLPGFPTITFLVIAAGLAGLAHFLTRQRQAAAEAISSRPRDIDPATGVPVQQVLPVAEVGEVFVIRIRPELFDAWQRYDLVTPIRKALGEVRRELGFHMLPPGFQVDPSIPAGRWVFEVEGIPAAEGNAAPSGPDESAAITPEALDWFARSFAAEWRKYAARGFGAAEANAWLEEMEKRFGSLVQGVRAAVPGMNLVGAVRKLLDDDVTLSQPRAILEALARCGPGETEDQIAERVRAALSDQIAYRLREDGAMEEAYLVGPDMEDALKRLQRYGPVRPRDDATEAGRVVTELRRVADQAASARPLLVASPAVRRYLASLCRANDIAVTVVSTEEAGGRFGVTTQAMIGLPGGAAPVRTAPV
ncbi:MAG: FHIPEP family type III secretion protein [Hyphomicrobiaceae bacterium]|nr:FHIPEP family type III secretion protein [Hyphomicrobiaceae bacterium]